MLSRSHTTEGINTHSKRAKNSTELLVNKQGSKEKLNFSQSGDPVEKQKKE